MIVVVCMEERNGMLFHNRRVSQDRVVYEDILRSCSDCLWMNAYSAPLFARYPQEKLRIDTNFLQKAERGQWCFVEHDLLESYMAEVEQLVVYRWNRRYPADVYFTVDLQEWTLVSTEEFSGHSHANITKEQYRR